MYRVKYQVRSGSGQGQVKLDLTPNKTVDRCLNNLSFFLENSDFWKGQGLTNQKCQSWIDEFSFCDLEMLLQQLQFAEFMNNVKTAKSPVDFFYKALVKGGITRPPGFEFPEERAARLQSEELETRHKAMRNLEKLRLQEKELAEKESFLSLLKDNKTIQEAITEFENSRHITTKLKLGIKHFKDTEQINGVLENRLRMWFRSDASNERGI